MVKKRVYPVDYLVEFVKDFYREHGRVPCSIDITQLSKQKKCPSRSVFISHGGLGLIIKKAGFSTKNKRRDFSLDSDDVVREIRIWIYKFLAENGRYPDISEFQSSGPIGEKTLYRKLGKSYNVFIKERFATHI